MKYLILNFFLAVIWILQTDFLLLVYQMKIMYVEKKNLSNLINNTINWNKKTVEMCSIFSNNSHLLFLSSELKI